MTGEKTLTIIKPHAVRDNKTGAILSIISDAGFRICAMKLIRLSEMQTKEFYKVHTGKDFYFPLAEMMASGPVVVALLKKENAVSEFRRLVGNTDPEKADPGTIRRLFGRTVRENAIHASDCDLNAQTECGFFFSSLEVFE